MIIGWRLFDFDTHIVCSDMCLDCLFNALINVSTVPIYIQKLYKHQCYCSISLFLPVECHSLTYGTDLGKPCFFSQALLSVPPGTSYNLRCILLFTLVYDGNGQQEKYREPVSLSVRCVIIKSCQVSKPQGWLFIFPYHFQIWQVPGQLYCCWGTNIRVIKQF